MAPRETEINAYAKFWSDQLRVLWYVMAFSVLVNWSLLGLKGLCYIFKGSWPGGGGGTAIFGLYRYVPL